LKDGSVDYEGRPNRSDKTPKKQYKLAHGGDVDNENAEMVLSKAKELEHHAEELKNVVKPNSKVEAWEVAKMERAATDASDVTHYEDGKKMYMAKGGKLSSKAKYIPKRDIEEVEVDQNGKEKMIDGADLLDGIYVKKKALAKKAPAKKKPTKKASGGEVKPKSNRGGNVGQIVKLAKEIRKDGEKWTDAVKRASAQLKK
jgi:hypothetical protein